MFKNGENHENMLPKLPDSLSKIQTKLGELMLQTHIGLSKEYEVSCDELDFLVDAVQNEKSVLGARMMGGGFGGCSINLVEKGLENELIKKIAAKYKTAFGIDLKSYKVKISKGTSFVKN